MNVLVLKKTGVTSRRVGFPVNLIYFLMNLRPIKLSHYLYKNYSLLVFNVTLSEILIPCYLRYGIIKDIKSGSHLFICDYQWQ